MQCTKLLVSRMHGGSLWLDKEYPIHVEDISRLTRLVEGGNALSTVFQVGAKQGKKQSEDNIYATYGTERGRRGAKLDKINKDDIRFACYLFAGKTMRHFTKNKFTLDAISIVVHCCRGEVLNWLAYLLNELFEACEDAYRRGTGFVF